jgi:hypothetical protein
MAASEPTAPASMDMGMSEEELRELQAEREEADAVARWAALAAKARSTCCPLCAPRQSAPSIALHRILLAFRDYQQSAEWEIARWQGNYARLRPSHKALLPNLSTKLQKARQAAHVNQLFLKAMLTAFNPDALAQPLPPHISVPIAPGTEGTPEGYRVSPSDTDKVSVPARKHCFSHQMHVLGMPIRLTHPRSASTAGALRP